MIRRIMGPNIKLNPLGVLLLCIAILGTLVYLFGLPTSWFSSPAPISMKQLLGVSIYLAQKGGVEVIRVNDAHTEAAVSKGKTKEGLADMKSQGDIKSHTAITSGFKVAFPDLKVVSEEHDPVANNPNLDQNIFSLSNVLNDVKDVFVPVKELAVWVDPLDATHEYIENNATLLKFVTVMVCVVHRGKPIMGIIHQPFGPKDASNRTYWAWVGHGQSNNLPKARKTADTGTGEKSTYQFVVSRAHKGAVEPAVKEAFSDKAVVKSAAGAGYKSLEVMRGDSDAYVHTTLIKKWDICAGNAIINHQGGKMTTIKGDIIDYSPDSNPKNPDGLLVSMTEESQKQFRSKLQPIFERMKKEEEERKKTT